MKILVNNIVVPLDTEPNQLRTIAQKKANILPQHCLGFAVTRRSVDARRGTVRFNYAAVLEVPDGYPVSPNAIVVPDEAPPSVSYGTKQMKHRPVVVGAGPAGLFCAYELARHGYAPVLLERGGKVSDRAGQVDHFFKTGQLDENCNIQFGEGGAGTFSDGKLTTRIGDPLCKQVLQTLIDCGAPNELAILAKPHIGTDLLRQIITALRMRIEQLGGQVHFRHQLGDLSLQHGVLESISVNGENWPVETVVLAIGHSARDTYELLHSKQVAMTPKAFAVGARIEHSQAFIDAHQYGKFAGHPKLGAADYRLAYNGKNRSCFSFCMCPGGVVVAAASEHGALVVNGMSNHARSGRNANSALVVQVTPQDFGIGVLDGVAFQRGIEQAAFRLSQSYLAPAQNTDDFLNGTKSHVLRGVKPTYPLGCHPSDLTACLPSFVCDVLADGLRYFDRSINGFTKQSVLTGVETRTSAPVRILRDETMQSVSAKGLYPIGEGAGYAGGIMSAAVDGIKAAKNIMQTYCPWD